MFAKNQLEKALQDAPDMEAQAEVFKVVTFVDSLFDCFGRSLQSSCPPQKKNGLIWSNYGWLSDKLALKKTLQKTWATRLFQPKKDQKENPVITGPKANCGGSHQPRDAAGARDRAQAAEGRVGLGGEEWHEHFGGAGGKWKWTLKHQDFVWFSCHCELSQKLKHNNRIMIGATGIDQD